MPHFPVNVPRILGQKFNRVVAVLVIFSDFPFTFLSQASDRYSTAASMYLDWKAREDETKQVR